MGLTQHIALFSLLPNCLLKGGTSMQRMHLPAVILLAALFLASCVVNDVKPDYTFKGDKPKGVVAVALTYHGGVMDFLLWRYRPVGQQKPRNQPQNTPQATPEQNPAIFSFGNSGSAVHWPPPINQAVPATRIAGRIAVVEIEPGTYEFFRWEGRSGNFLLNSGVKPLAIRFTVEAGKVTYLGDVHMFWENPAYRVGVYDMRDR